MKPKAKISKQPLEIELVKIVRSKCPFMSFMYDKDFEFEKQCKPCEYLIMTGIDNDSTPLSCGWIVYSTDIVSQKTYDDEDDGSGAMPSTDYQKTIACYSCGEGMNHHSGMSWFTHGDKLTCMNCKTSHRYLGTKDETLFFSVPINTKSTAKSKK